MELFGAALTMVVGGGFIVLGYGALTAARRRASRGRVTDGVVVDSTWEGTGGVQGPTRYAAPQVEFVDDTGSARRFTHHAGTNLRPRTGRQVRVWYDPDDPATEPVIHQEGVATALPVLFLVVGAVAVVVGLALLRSGLS